MKKYYEKLFFLMKKFMSNDFNGFLVYLEKKRGEGGIEWFVIFKRVFFILRL